MRSFHAQTCEKSSSFSLQNWQESAKFSRQNWQETTGFYTHAQAQCTRMLASSCGVVGKHSTSSRGVVVEWSGSTRRAVAEWSELFMAFTSYFVSTPCDVPYDAPCDPILILRPILIHTQRERALFVFSEWRFEMIVNESWIEAAQYLPLRERMRFYTAVLEYTYFGREPEFKMRTTSYAMFLAIRSEMDFQREHTNECPTYDELLSAYVDECMSECEELYQIA